MEDDDSKANATNEGVLFPKFAGLPGEVYRLLINCSSYVMGLIWLFASCRWIEVGHPTEGGDPETGIGRGDQSTHVGVPPPISMGDLVIRETTETGVIQATTSEDVYIIMMIALTLKGHMTMRVKAEDINTEVMTLISLHMTATDMILNSTPPRKRMNPSQLY